MAGDDRRQRRATMFVGLVILLVLIGLCVALGAIYSYIYFTRTRQIRQAHSIFRDVFYDNAFEAKARAVPHAVSKG